MRTEGTPRALITYKFTRVLEDSIGERVKDQRREQEMILVLS